MRTMTSLVTVDTHAHVGMREFDDDRDLVIQRARDSGVRFLEVSYDEESSVRSVSLARRLGVCVALGIHPHYSGAQGKVTESTLQDRWGRVGDLALANPDRVVALGEMGLDYFRNRIPRETQIECFRAGLDLARKLGLPVIVHQRDAEEDTLRVISQAGLSQPIVFHCFSQEESYARRCLDLGGYLGIGGVLTFRRNDPLREAVGKMPRDRLLVETDCPYLAPQEHRGRRNEPSFVLLTVKVLAAVLRQDAAQVIRDTTENATRILGTSILRPSV